MENEQKEVTKSKGTKNIIIFFIVMVLSMFIFDIVNGLLYPIISRMFIYGKYGSSAIVEAVCAFIILIVLLLFKNSYIFTEKKTGFLKSLLVGGYITVIATILLGISITSIKGTINILDLGSLIIFCLFIGIFEEFLCRGWIQNEFIERFDNTRKGVILSIFLSALIFGGIHISNIWIGGQSVIETIAQIVQAVGLGFLLGSIYYRTKNIWSVVFLHGYWDFSLFLGEINIIKACTDATSSLEGKIFSLISSLLIALASTMVGLYVLRKNKTQGYIEGENLTPEELTKSKKRSKYYVLAAIIFFFGINFVPTVENEQICYEYEEKSIAYQEIISPVYTEYTIKDLHLKVSLNDAYELSITNLKTNQEVILEDIIQFIIVEDNGIYKMMLIGLNEYQTDTKVYYSESLTKDSFSDDESYLNNIKDSFKELDDAPTASDLRYIVSTDNNKYLILNTDNNELLVLDNGKLYILVHQENEEETIEEPSEDIQENNNEEEPPIENPSNENLQENENPEDISVENTEKEQGV